MLSKIKNRKEEGFTIIEVLIVLAIAGLIMLIVFLAVPALQRTQRNTARKNDVARIGGAATEWLNNNNGAAMTLGDASSAGTAQDVANAAGNLSQYDFTADATKFVVVANTVGNAGDIDTVQLAVKAKCGTGGAVTGGTARQMAIMYSVENSSGTTPVCTDI